MTTYLEYDKYMKQVVLGGQNKNGYHMPREDTDI